VEAYGLRVYTIFLATQPLVVLDNRCEVGGQG